MEEYSSNTATLEMRATQTPRKIKLGGGGGSAHNLCISNDVINSRFPFPYIAHVNKLLYYQLKLAME